MSVQLHQGHPRGARYFGAAWDAPVTDDGTQVPTPVGERCYGCTEAIAEGDRGYPRPGLGGDGQPVELYVHVECDLQGIVGHMVSLCDCYPFNGSRRARAIECWNRWIRRNEQ